MAPTLESMIRSSLWAGTLPPGELDRVVREAHERKVPVGGHAMRSGDAAGLWVGVIEGLLKMSVSRADGRHSTFTGVTAGGWAGEGTLLKAESHWRYDGIAVRPSRLACVPRHTFERLVSTYIAFNRFLLQHINARLSLFIGLVEFDRLLGRRARGALPGEPARPRPLPASRQSRAAEPGGDRPPERGVAPARQRVAAPAGTRRALARGVRRRDARQRGRAARLL